MRKMHSPSNPEIEAVRLNRNRRKQNIALVKEDIPDTVSDISCERVQDAFKDTADNASRSPPKLGTTLALEGKSTVASKALSIPEVCNSKTSSENFQGNVTIADCNYSLLSVSEVSPEPVLHREGTSIEEVDKFPTENSHNEVNTAAEGDIRKVSKSAYEYEEDVNWPLVGQGSHTDFRESLNLLHGNQVTFAQHVVECLRNNYSFHYFLTGLAGSGKSHVVKILAKLVELIYSDSTRSCSVLVLAPTAKTASIVNGMTIEEALAIPLSCHEYPNLPSLPACVVESLRSQYKSVQLVIIDEVSSVGNCLISHVNARLKQIFDAENDFGNLSVLLVGDLRQVSPKNDSPIFKNVPLWENFKYYELLTIERHGNDPDFCRILDNFSKGELTEDDLEILNHRNFEIAESLICPCLKNLYVFCDADEVNCFNNYALKNLSGKEFISIAEDELLGPVSSEHARSFIKSLDGKILSDIEGLPHSLVLKESAKYMISHDIDTAAGLGAGAVGVIRNLITKNEEVTEILFELDDRVTLPEHLIKKRTKNPLESGIVVIRKISRELRHNFLHNLTHQRRQFPLIPAEAALIDDIRGRTASCICIPINSSAKMKGCILYTALSRVESLKNLHFTGCITEALSVKDDELKQELLRLRNAALLTLPDTHLGEMEKNFTICYVDLTNLIGNRKSLFSETFIEFYKNYLGSLCRQHSILVFRGIFTKEEVRLLCGKLDQAGFTSNLLIFRNKEPTKFKRNNRSSMFLFFSRSCFRKVQYRTPGRKRQGMWGLVKIESMFILFVSDVPAFQLRKVINGKIPHGYNLIVIGCLEPSTRLQNLKLVKSIRSSSKRLFNSVFTNLTSYKVQLHCLPLFHKFHWPLCIEVSRKP